MRFLKKLGNPTKKIRFFGLIGLLEKSLYLYGIRSARNLTLPDFLCIGAQKAGTTWLFENMSHHPEIFLPENTKHYDLHYFDQQFNRSLRYYAGYFEKGRGKVKGENTPAYGIMSVSRIKFLRKIVPDVRLVLMIRNPIDRAWSHARMAMYQKSNGAPENVTDEEFLNHFLRRRSRSRSDYLSIIDKWLSVFPKDQLFVGIFDDMVNRPEDLLRRVFRHIGVSTDVDFSSYPCFDRINKGVSVEMPPNIRVFLEKLYSDELEQLAERFGEPVKSWLPPKSES